MTRFTPSLALLAIVCLLTTVPGHAQSNRTFISGAGSDTNPCTFTTPCRTAQRAHDMTNPGGEINILDPAGYGALTITKAIGIQGHGWGELVGAGGATAVTINAGATDKINLRGLVIEGFGTGDKGIAFNAGASLNIQDSTIRNFTGSGIAAVPNGMQVAVRIVVTRTVLSDNTGHGAYVQPSNTTSVVTAFFNRVEAYGNGQQGIGLFGNLSQGHVLGHIVDSTAAHNGSHGYYALGPSSGPTTFLKVFRSTTFANGTGGIQADFNSGITVSLSNVESDSWSDAGPGCIGSYGNNMSGGVPSPCAGIVPQ